MIGHPANIEAIRIGEALLSGLLRAGRQVKDLVVAERIPERARYLAETYSVLVSSVTDAVQSATFVIVAVKPADVESVIGEIAHAATEAKSDSGDQVFVTVAAGVTIQYFESRLPAGTPVIRAMPNAPSLVGAGVTALLVLAQFIHYKDSASDADDQSNSKSATSGR